MKVFMLKKGRRVRQSPGNGVVSRTEVCFEFGSHAQTAALPNRRVRPFQDIAELDSTETATLDEVS